ncbi:catalase [Curtobacterium sp. MCBA15_013]|uniref:catalase n=1 Tax=Curtobacterium sp. MCBA15_013 TaxID=1898739 RepID=UPI0008DDCAE4|nr:catalase [Curtobacterium sp. MCBA15_013]OII21869.1 catalase [Curtobacterium sp. MCBA15_013]
MTADRLTDLTGAPVASNDHSLTAGPDGATVLHDRYLLEKLAHFARERIPERVVHAKGGGAFGAFTVTGDVSAYTRAAVFQPHAQSETLARFSTVAGEQGSPDTWRDVRGFSVRFYTAEGNYDIVGNNTPVFFIRDAVKFPDFIHSQKRLPDSALRNADMQWDFWSLSPESAHQVTYLMGDRGIPASWRTMPGYGSHTFQWINADGDRFWVKYHWKPLTGEAELTAETAEQLAGQDADYYRRDLFTAIADGNHPSWDLNVQIMPYEEAKTYRFNPFDVTKVWPHSDYPLIKVGTMTLNRNPENFFVQIEQASFSPANLVPGTDVSPDKMLMARVFSYPDAQRYRLGVNYNELPSNRPKTAVHNYMQDGAARTTFNAPTTPVYAPNSFNGPIADPAAAGKGSWESDGVLVMSAQTLHSDDDDFGQAGALYREVFTDAQKARLLRTLAGQLTSITVPRVRDQALRYWAQVDTDLGKQLIDAVATADLAPTAAPPVITDTVSAS